MNENNVPNLDCETSDDLLAFWTKHQRGRSYLALFPSGGVGTKRATADLANYASNKATAQTCRLLGDIRSAAMYEDIADRIYEGLPEFAKW